MRRPARPLKWRTTFQCSVRAVEWERALTVRPVVELRIAMTWLPLLLLNTTPSLQLSPRLVA